MAPLDRALALDERQHRAVGVAEQLHFDVARPRQPALEIDRRIAERGARFRPRRAHGAGEIGCDRSTVRIPLPPPPATAFTSSG